MLTRISEVGFFGSKVTALEPSIAVHWLIDGHATGPRAAPLSIVTGPGAVLASGF